MVCRKRCQHTFFNQDSWRLWVAARLFDISTNFDPRTVDHRNFGGGQLRCNLITIRAMLDYETNRELLGYAYRRHDVVGAVCMGAKTDRFLNHGNERFHAQVALAFSLHVIVCLDQRLTEHRRDAHAGHRTFLTASVGSLRAFAERNFHAHRSRNKHLFECSADDFHSSGLAADHVVTAGHHPHGGNTAFQGIVKANVFRIDGVDRAYLWDNRVVHFVFVALIGADTVLPEAKVSVSIDHSWNHHFARKIPNFGVLWHTNVSTDLLDCRIPNKQRPVVDPPFCCSHQGCAR